MQAVGRQIMQHGLRKGRDSLDGGAKEEFRGGVEVGLNL